MFADATDGWAHILAAVKLSIVASWHRALDAGAIDALLDVTSPAVAVGGPRGTAHGHDVLRAWAAGAGASLEPVRWFCGVDGEVVVEQRATWRDEDERRSPPVDVATRFTVRDGLIVRIDRHDDLDTALAASGLSPSDLVQTGS